MKTFFNWLVRWSATTAVAVAANGIALRAAETKLRNIQAQSFRQLDRSLASVASAPASATGATGKPAGAKRAPGSK